MARNNSEIQDVVLRQVFLDAFKDKPYTSTSELRECLRKHLKSKGVNVSDPDKLHSRVSAVLLNLRKQNIICKPMKSTTQDGHWTMTNEMIREFRNRFVRRQYYKHKYCNHLDTKKVTPKGWEYEVTEYRCPILKCKIENPEIHCDLLYGTKRVVKQVEDAKTKKKVLIETWDKCTTTMCPGYTRNKSTSETLDISSNLIWRELISELKQVIQCKINKETTENIKHSLSSYLPYSLRGTDISNLFPKEEKEESVKINLQPKPLYITTNI